MPRKKITEKTPLISRLINVNPDLDMKVRLKISKERARLKTKKAHTLAGLTRRLWEGWVEGKYEI